MWIAATPSATQHYVCHDALRQDLISESESKKIEFLYNTAFHCKLLNYFPSFRLVVQFANSCCMLLHISGSEKLVMTIKWPTLRCIRGESICICGTGICICRGFWMVFSAHTYTGNFCVPTDAFRLLQLQFR